MDRRCENCDFWVAFPQNSGLAGKGRCHRFPPFPDGGGFPVTGPDKWCGEFKSNETGEGNGRDE